MFNDLGNLFKFDKTNIHLAGKVAAKAYFDADDFTISSKDPSKQMKYLTKLMNLTIQELDLHFFHELSLSQLLM